MSDECVSGANTVNSSRARFSSELSTWKSEEVSPKRRASKRFGCFISTVWFDYQCNDASEIIIRAFFPSIWCQDEFVPFAFEVYGKWKSLATTTNSIKRCYYCWLFLVPVFLIPSLFDQLWLTSGKSKHAIQTCWFKKAILSPSLSLNCLSLLWQRFVVKLALSIFLVSISLPVSLSLHHSFRELF